MQTPSIAYTILALAPLTGAMQHAWQDAPLLFDRQQPDRAMATLRPSLFISLSVSLCPAGGLQLTFQRLRDLTPDGLLESQPYLADLVAAGRFLDRARRQGNSEAEIATGLQQWPDLPQVPLQAATEKKPLPTPAEDGDPLDKILSMVAMPESSRPAVADDRPFDRILGEILTCIFQDRAFRRMEAAWQGVRLLAAQGGMQSEVDLHLVPTTRDTLEETLVDLPGHVLDDLPALLLADCAFDSSARSMHLLEALARCAHTLLVPALAWIKETFFHVDSWPDMNSLPFLPHHLASQEYAKWRRLQESGEGRWLGLLCNRFLCRFPYGPDNRLRQIDFREPAPPWVAPVWAVACLAGQAMATTGWPAGVSDHSRFRVTDLGLHQATTHPIPLETMFSDSRLEQLFRCGIMALAAARGKDMVFLPADVMASADVSFSYQALLSRFTQFVLWCRDHFDEDLGREALAPALEQTFQLFREQQGDRTGGALQVTVKEQARGRQPLVRLQWDPPRRLLADGNPIVLEFPW